MSDSIHSIPDKQLKAWYRNVFCSCENNTFSNFYDYALLHQLETELTKRGYKIKKCAAVAKP